MPVDNKGRKAGGSGSEAIAARLLRMFGEEALADGAVASQQQQEQQRQEGGEAAEEGSPSSAMGSATTRPRLPTAAENWARGWRGNPLLLFPEGTTSNGSCLLRFKTGVFASGVPVYPVTVKYNVRRFSPAFERCVGCRKQKERWRRRFFRGTIRYPQQHAVLLFGLEVTTALRWRYGALC